MLRIGKYISREFPDKPHKFRPSPGLHETAETTPRKRWIDPAGIA